MNISKKLLSMMRKGIDLLGSEYSIICGAMTWISDEHLVSAVSNSGAFGVLAGGSMDPEQLKQHIIATKNLTNKNFGVNLILVHPQLHELIEVCGEQHVSHIVYAGGVPTLDIIKKAHDYNMKCLAFAPTLAIAKRMFKQGVDGIIIEGHESGGHVGPVSTLVLVQEILLQLPDKPIFVAGGIVRGEVMASLLAMGAAGCQMGSIFACCKESTAHSNFKKAFLAANSRNAVVSVQLDRNFPVTAVRALENQAYRDFMQKQKEALLKFESGELSLEEAKLSLEHFWAGALKRAAVNGDLDTGSIMAGQSVGLISEELSINDILQKMFSEADNYLDTICNMN